MYIFIHLYIYTYAYIRIYVNLCIYIMYEYTFNASGAGLCEHTPKFFWFHRALQPTHNHTRAHRCKYINIVIHRYIRTPTHTQTQMYVNIYININA